MSEEIKNTGIAEQLLDIIPQKLRTIFLILCIFGGGSLGGGSIMGVMQNNSPVSQDNKNRTDLLIDIKDAQDDMADLQKEHSKELHAQSKAQALFNTRQELHSQAIRGIKDDIDEMKTDVKDNRNHDHQ